MVDAIEEESLHMTTVREIIKRDIGVKVEGVVKVFDRSALASEVREYVVTDKIEDELKRIVDTFTQVSETLRQNTFWQGRGGTDGDPSRGAYHRRRRLLMWRHYTPCRGARRDPFENTRRARFVP